MKASERKKGVAETRELEMNERLMLFLFFFHLFKQDNILLLILVLSFPPRVTFLSIPHALIFIPFPPVFSSPSPSLPFLLLLNFPFSPSVLPVSSFFFYQFPPLMCLLFSSLFSSSSYLLLPLLWQTLHLPPSLPLSLFYFLPSLYVVVA